MFDLSNIFNKNRNKAALTKDELAALLKTTPEALKAFEKAYELHSMKDEDMSDNLFEINAKQAASFNHKENAATVSDTELEERIVNELLARTVVYSYDGAKADVIRFQEHGEYPPVTVSDIMSLPYECRPQLTGSLVQKDIAEDSSSVLLMQYRNFLNETNPQKKQQWYNMFRQGLDILDLDPITYEILGMNQNSMGHWFPALVDAVSTQDFFILPKTKIMKVPMSLLQQTRMDYNLLTPATMRIVDKFCEKAFELDPKQEYFIKTGTYSSKFDFRNAHVQGEKEVKELGEYLLFIQFQAQQMAAPLSTPCIYGVSTTNEWVVREYIPDKENNPCIYKGLPLHTEYRIFVDFDTDEIIGINPYWDPEVMKQRFGHEDDADTPHQIHDYVIYQMHEQVLMERYENNKALIQEKLAKIIPLINLSGQWSVDIMQHRDEFYIIDMALAYNSALNNCVSKEKLRTVKEDWIPRLPE